MSAPVVGKVYDVDHQRKGKFRIEVTAVDGEWITGDMVEGTTITALPMNSRTVGEEVTIRESLAKFTEVTP